LPWALGRPQLGGVDLWLEGAFFELLFLEKQLSYLGEFGVLSRLHEPIKRAEFHLVLTLYLLPVSLSQTLRGGVYLGLKFEFSCL
jgi:hypothetical protein